MDEKTELTELIDELVSKVGPTAGQIKLNQDLVKVERLLALGWKPGWVSVDKKLNKKSTLEEKVQKLENTQVKILQTLAEHDRRIKVCEIRR